MINILCVRFYLAAIIYLLISWIADSITYVLVYLLIIEPAPLHKVQFGQIIVLVQCEIYKIHALVFTVKKGMYKNTDKSIKISLSQLLEERPQTPACSELSKMQIPICSEPGRRRQPSDRLTNLRALVSERLRATAFLDSRSRRCSKQRRSDRQTRPRTRTSSAAAVVSRYFML